MSIPHISVLNVEFVCTVSTYVRPYLAAGTAGSASDLYCMPLLPPCARIALIPAPFCLLHRASMSNSKTMLEQRQQMERERTAAKTQNKRTTALLPLRIAISFTLTPQCSTFTFKDS